MEKQTYTLTLPLETEKWQADILHKRLEIARHIYNTCLGEVMKRQRRMRQDKDYRCWVQQEKSKQRTQGFKDLNKKYGLSEYAMHTFVKPMQHHFKKNIDSFTAQKIATRTWQTFERYLFGDARRVNFKRHREMVSVEGKTNTSGIRFKDNKILWKALEIPVNIKFNDIYAHIALNDTVKYCRILRKTIRGKNRYYVQLIMKGFPPKKIDNNTGKLKHLRGIGTVGIDIGTQTIAVVSETEVKLLELAPNVDTMEREKRILQRKLDRKRRANNPHKYNEDGTNKRTREKWIDSNNYLKTKSLLAEVHRKIADKRKQAHNKLANWILSLGDDVKVETMNFKGLQERTKKTTVNKRTGRINRMLRFGKSLQNKAPSSLLTILDNKLKYEGAGLKRIDTYKVKASQYNHFTSKYIKKSLSERWNNFSGTKIQRDLYSAFLIRHVKENLEEVDIQNCESNWELFKMHHDVEIIRLTGKTENLISMGI